MREKHTGQELKLF